jgi:hypothetical protein
MKEQFRWKHRGNKQSGGRNEWKMAVGDLKQHGGQEPFPNTACFCTSALRPHCILLLFLFLLPSFYSSDLSSTFSLSFSSRVWLNLDLRQKDWL